MLRDVLQDQMTSVSACGLLCESSRRWTFHEITMVCLKQAPWRSSDSPGWKAGGRWHLGGFDILECLC